MFVKHKAQSCATKFSNQHTKYKITYNVRRLIYLNRYSYYKSESLSNATSRSNH